MSQAQIVINDLNDFNLGQVASTFGDLEADVDFCVLVQPRRGRYSVVANGSGAGNAFHITSGPYFVPYQVFYSNRRNGNGARALTSGVPTTGLLGQRNRPALNWNCRRPNSNLRIFISGDDLANAASGLYTGTLRLTVIPE